MFGIVIAVIGALGSIATAGSLLYVARQTSLARRANDHESRIAWLSAHSRVTDLALAVDRVFIELPHVRPYFYAGATRGSATDDQWQQVLAVAEYIVDYIEEAVIYRRILGDPVLDRWSVYYAGLFRCSPAIREFFDENQAWYDDDVRKLFELAAGTPVAGAAPTVDLAEPPQPEPADLAGQPAGPPSPARRPASTSRS